MLDNRVIMGIDPSYDPGGITGVCVGQMLNGKMWFNFHEVEVLDGRECIAMAQLYTLIKNTRPDVVYCESYECNQAGKHLTKELIGMIKVFCSGIPTDAIPLKMTPASKSKYYWTDERLVQQGILEKKGTKYIYGGKTVSKHCRDALRQVLCNELTSGTKKDRDKRRHK